MKDKRLLLAVLDPLDPDRIHLSWWIARIRIRFVSPCNWIACERDRSGFVPDTAAHVNVALMNGPFMLSGVSRAMYLMNTMG